MKRRWWVFVALILGCFSAVEAQVVALTGRVSGGGAPLEGASVILLGTDPLVGATTSTEGKFALEAPLGRHTLRVSSIGYEERELEVVCSAGRDVHLEVVLEPAAYTLEGVEVVRHHDKSRPIQPLLYAGARSFSVEETERYAGSLGDPSRMVRSFAGVMPINDSRNEIVVRGNSPLGVQYRLDGIEVPNPNHFNAGIGMTAGQVTALNMNLVTNSDFLLGGWAATKGNALAAIFDLNLRRGNPLRHQMRLQMGYNGLEVMGEGPIGKKGGGASYVASYRYSIPELMSYAMKLFSKEMAIVPKYQDFTTKLHWDLNDRHSLSLIGMVGTSGIDMQLSKIQSNGSVVEVEATSFDQRVALKSLLSIMGLVYRGQWTPNTDLKASLSWNYNKINLQVDSVNLPRRGDWQELYVDRSTEHKLSLTADLHHRFPSHRDHLYTGVVLDHYLLNIYNATVAYPFPLNDDDACLSLLRAYAQYQHLFSDEVTATVGAHAMYLPLNNSFSLEPRAALEIKLGANHTLGLSGGLYAQLPPHTFFFVKEASGEYNALNHELGFSKSWHGNLSYNYQISKDWRVRTELYYQSHFDIPVEEMEYGRSLLNFGAGENNMDRIPNLKNIGTGRNYGMELTVEKFFSQNYFLLVSGTLYRSLYTDPILKKEFSTVFDGGYILNVTGGMEYPINTKWTIFAAPQLALSGGLRYTPVDEAASIAQHEEVYIKEQWFGKKLPAYFRLDTRIGARLNGKKTSQEWGIDLINITNRKNVAFRAFDVDKGDYVTQYHFTFFPMVTYRLNFGL